MVVDINAENEYEDLGYVHYGEIRVFIKIQDGCNRLALLYNSICKRKGKIQGCCGHFKGNHKISREWL